MNNLGKQSLSITNNTFEVTIDNSNILQHMFNLISSDGPKISPYLQTCLQN